MGRTNIYNIARQQAHREGIKIVNKDQCDICGYRVGEGFEGHTVELMQFDASTLRWEAYDMDFGYLTMSDARESAKSHVFKS